MSTTKIFGREFVACATCLAFLGLGLCGSASAATIAIDYTGLNIQYDGTDITDVPAGGGGPDELTSVVVSLNGVQINGVLDTGLTADLLIPSVTNLAVGGDTEISDPGGFLDLDLGGGSFLHLDLDEVTVEFVDLGSAFQFIFAASTSDVDSQSLPFGLVIDENEKVDMTFSARINAGTLLDNGFDLTSFLADATGSIGAQQDLGGQGGLPEPASIVIMLMALVGIAGTTRRRA